MLPNIDWDEIDWDKDNGVFINKVKPTYTKLSKASRERELVKERVNDETPTTTIPDSTTTSVNRSTITTNNEVTTTTNGGQSTTTV
ncbi:hypothetical protein LCGC14_3107270 [marine sediment metagenome]|uniref:Uncharacterized protein n=1 Tax=marine sediment metagenome TaxID=412755 RepID=A0A0F8WUW3_9ZZZZ